LKKKTILSALKRKSNIFSFSPLLISDRLSRQKYCFCAEEFFKRKKGKSEMTPPTRAASLIPFVGFY
jgi:hypothetical protein